MRHTKLDRLWDKLSARKDDLELQEFLNEVLTVLLDSKLNTRLQSEQHELNIRRLKHSLCSLLSRDLTKVEKQRLLKL
jgi:hypothetical protein